MYLIFNFSKLNFKKATIFWFNLFFIKLVSCNIFTEFFEGVFIKGSLSKLVRKFSDAKVFKDLKMCVRIEIKPK